MINEFDLRRLIEVLVRGIKCLWCITSKEKGNVNELHYRLWRYL